MPLKLNIGLSRKVGEANYGSRGATVNVELEVDSSLATEPAKLQERIRAMFNLVRASVNEELNGSNGNAPTEAPAPAPPSTNGNGNGNGYHQAPPKNTNGNGNGNGNGYRQASPPANGSKARPATVSQVRAIHAIASRLNVNLNKLLTDRFQIASPEQLSLRDASGLIDELKSEGT